MNSRSLITVVVAALLLVAGAAPAVAEHGGTLGHQTCPPGWKDTSVGAMEFCSHPDHGSKAADAAWRTWRQASIDNRVTRVNTTYDGSVEFVAASTVSVTEEPVYDIEGVQIGTRTVERVQRRDAVDVARDYNAWVDGSNCHKRDGAPCEKLPTTIAGLCAEFDPDGVGHTLAGGHVCPVKPS